MENRRRWTIGAAIGLTLLALVVLASGLSSLKLGAGTPLPPLDLFQFEGPSGTSTATSTGFASVLRVLIGVVFWVLLPLSIVYLVLSADARRRLWRDLLWITSILMMAYLIVRLFRMLDVGTTGDGQSGSRPGTGTGASRSVEPPDFVSHPPDWIVLIASGVIFAAIGFLAWWLWRRRASASSVDDDLQDDLVEQAGAALDDVRSGEDVANVVVRCYREMERAVRRAHGWGRRASMTPREFERRLADAGLDPDAVGRLTRLFERVRYGHHDVGAVDEAEAEACLAAITGQTAVGESA